MINKLWKSTDTLEDALFLRTIFIGNCDSVASYKFWFKYFPNARYVRGRDIRYVTDFKINFVI